MEAHWTHPGRTARPPIALLSRLTMAALVGTAATFALMQLVVMRTADPTLVVPMALLLGAVALIRTRWRWTPLLGAALCGVLAAGLLALPPPAARTAALDWPVTAGAVPVRAAVADRAGR